MTYETLLYERQGPVGVLTLNRPNRANAMNSTMLAELQHACDAIEADAAVRAVVLTGAGGAFCSGFDLKEQAENRPQGVGEWTTALRADFEAVMRFWRLSKPTVAAVRGAALAGGFELSMACDLTVAAEDAVFGEPELKFGAGIVVMLLPWLAGAKAAKEIILLGLDDVSAARARELGLVNRVVPSADVAQEALSMARRLAALDPMLVTQTKRAINRSLSVMGLEEALEASLDIDIQIEGEGSEHKTEFLRRLREEGMAAALAWRDGRLSGDD